MQFGATATELLGPPELKKNVLHCIAEYNFFQGMRLLLEFEKSSKAACAAKDSQGYTPLMYTIKYGSYETLEAMVNLENIEFSAKSTAGKTALEMAKDIDDQYHELLNNYRPNLKISNVSMFNSVRGGGKGKEDDGQST